MMPSSLYSVNGKRHFMTKRFDRKNGKKLFTQTLAALYPDADSYEKLLIVCRKLHLPEPDCQEVFRRMVFNILANNTDDHNKNFSFIMSENGTWSLAPAYDLTYVLDLGGNLPNEDHCLFMRAKLSNFSQEDVVAFAHDNGIQRPDAIIRDVADALKQSCPVAEKNGVSAGWIGRVESTILGHLRAWGESDEPMGIVSSEVNDHKISDIRIEQTYKGNYHLLANIDGAERKFVIGKNRREYAEIEKAGIANITSDQLLEMAKRLFAYALTNRG